MLENCPESILSLSGPVMLHTDPFSIASLSSFNPLQKGWLFLPSHRRV